MSRYDDQGVWHPPVEPGRLEYEAELCTRNPAPPTCVDSGIGRCINNVPCVNGKCQLDTARLVQAATTKPAAVLKGYYDFVNEVPKVRVDLTPEGRELPAGTKLWPHPMPPQPLPKLPPVPKDMCFGSMTIGDKRVELRGWTTEMMQPWIDAVLAAFKESRR